MKTLQSILFIYNRHFPLLFLHLLTQNHRESTTSNTFEEYHEARPQSRDTIQGLILDVQQVPFTHLNSKDGDERWVVGEDFSGSQGSVFMPSTTAGHSGSSRKHERQNSLSPVSTIGKLAAAATARIFPADVKGQQQENHNSSQEQHISSRQAQPVSISVSSCSESARQQQQPAGGRTDAVSLPQPCPTTIVTISGSLSTAAHNAMNSAIYPALYSSNTNIAANSSQASSNGLMKNSPSVTSTANDKDLLIGPDLHRGRHNTVSRNSDNEGNSLDDRNAATMLSQTQPEGTKSSICVSGQSSGQRCTDYTCLRCRATELEPLCLAQTECSPYPFPPDLKVGHVNQVYMPESPLSPIYSTGNDVYDALNHIETPRQHYNQKNNHIYGGGIVMPTCSGNSGSQRSRHSTGNSRDTNQSHLRPNQVHFDQFQVDENMPVSNNGTRQNTSDAGKAISKSQSSPATDKLLLCEHHSRAAGNVRNDESASKYNTDRLAHHNSNSRYNNFVLTSVPSNNPNHPTGLPTLSINPEEQYFSDGNQDTRTQPVVDDDNSDIDESQNRRSDDAIERHHSDSQQHQKAVGRYRKRGTAGPPYLHPTSFPESAPGKQKSSPQHNSGRDSLLVSAGQKYVLQPAKTHIQGNTNTSSYQEGSRVIPEPQRLCSIPLDLQRTRKLSHLNPSQQQTQRVFEQDDQKLEESASFFLSDPNSVPPSPEVGVSTAAAMFIPAMATNLLPFPVPIQSSIAFSHKPVTKQQARHLAGDPDSGTECDKTAADSAGTAAAAAPRKKKTSLVALVRGRRSDKGKSKGLSHSKHNRSLSLNRSTGSGHGKVVMLKHQRSKEI